MIIALAGQPNSGKSTIFNQVAGYKTVTSNFPGKTVKYTKSKVRLGEEFELVDLPGTYSLTSSDLAELEARKYILKGEADLVVNVIDASILSRSLEFTIQLCELKVPMIICLNMKDEAERKGIFIDTEKLEEIFGVPVVSTIANKGIGVKELFSKALEQKKKPKLPKYSKDVEKVIEEFSSKVKNEPKRLIAIKVLEGDEAFIEKTDINYKKFQKILEYGHGRPSDLVISSERHALSMNIFEEVATVKKPEKSLFDLDRFLMGTVGYPILALILYSLFYLVFTVGGFFEAPMMNYFDILISKIVLENAFLQEILVGVVQGIAGGVGIVLPYLLPLFIGLAFLEDAGYLPRVAFLLDRFFHKIGLHGKSIIPFILGYGCTVPAIMGTRILESERDRFIAGFMSVFVPCSARTVVIFGLVAVYLGPWLAFLLYITNIIFLGLLGFVLSRIYRERTPGLILEIPSLKRPSFKTILMKTWLRMREFIVIAWPLLIVGSIVLSLLEYYGLADAVNTLFSPFTLVLGLPVAVGITLIFGILRKEISLLMLRQALGSLEILSKTQMLTFTVFVMYYVPCLATIAVLVNEFRIKRTVLIVFVSIVVALLLGLLARGMGSLAW
ncbi:MAG: ferrous iron transport protein B [Euryarchaeota archaeon]|nr:ferrous iron transport protein B [Euryarchaeota archaeon]